MRLALAVALGGALGSCARWWLGGWVQRRASAASGAWVLFPAEWRSASEGFLAELEPHPGGGMVTLEKVEVVLYRPHREGEPPA